MIGAPMLIAASPAAPGAAVRPRPATARLLLFVGEALRPDAALSQALGRDGVRCLCLPGIEQARQAARLAVFDGVVVDGRTIEGEAGRRLAALRDALEAPILVIGPNDDVIDEIVALESGADAWLAPPCTPRRLHAHVGALLRRRPPPREPAPAAAPPAPGRPGPGGWLLDALHQRLVRGTHEVALTEGQALLLQCLFDCAGALVSRARLLAALPQGQRLQLRSADVYVSRLRRTLRHHGVEGFVIEAVRGRGFVLRVQPPAHA